MPLLNCPECGHDVSSSAIACPNCGKPLQYEAPPPTPVVVADPPREDGIPPWAMAAIGIAVIGLVFLAFVVFQRTNDEANSNVRVSVEQERAARRSSTSSDDYSATAPSGVTDSAPVGVPGSQTTVPGAQTEIDRPEKGSVRIAAKVMSANGSPQAVANEKFYLLEKSLEEILDDANLTPIEGNTLANSLGLAVMYPERFGDFRQKALAAINNEIKYSGTTDSNGTTNLTGVEPGSYYLFGVTKTGKGFAMWSSPVSVIAGENRLDLAPARINEISG